MLEAEKSVDEAKGHVQSAVDELANVVVARCTGSDMYNSRYSQDLKDALYELMQVREKLD